MIIVIEKKTPSVNHLYGHTRKGFFYIKNEGRALRKLIDKLVKDQKLDVVSLKGKKLNVVIDIHENWHTKKGDVARKDISNREKFLTDSVFTALGLDDRYIFKQTFNKIQSNEEKSIISIEEYKNVSTI